MRIIYAYIIIVFPNFLFSQSPNEDSNWDLMVPKFSEDFNSVTPSIWNTVNGNWGGEDFGFYPERVNINTTILSGNNSLELSALNDNVHPLSAISSGMIVTTSAFKYGYYEANIKFATIGYSYMPAFWLFDKNNCDEIYGPTITCACPSGSGNFVDEIDIEIFGQPSGTDCDLTTNFHFLRPGICPNITDFNLFKPFPGLQNDFHKYGIEWTPNQVIFYYDDVPFRIKKDNIPSNFMKIWLDVGFRNPGSHTNNDFPGNMYVDYVNVYDLKMDCSNAYVGSLALFDYKVKRDISLSGGFTNILPITSNVTLRASNSVTILDETTVPFGAEFTILPTSCY